jgi:hypothetical protein
MAFGWSESQDPRNFHSTAANALTRSDPSVRETGDFGAFLDLLFAFLVCCVGKIREFPQHILTHSDTCANGGKSMNKDIRVSTMKKRYFPPVQMDLSVHTYQCIMILTMLYSSFTARQYGGPPGRRLG